ncbi:hypothetical protein YC2023_031280 [Brassica napus]
MEDLEKMLIACRVEAMDESGAGDRSTAAKLTEKLKGEDVKKGVESYTKDTENQKVAVSGSFDLEKLLKKLKKVTGGKGVEVVKEEEKDIPEPEIVEVVKEKDEETEVVQEVKTEENARPEVVFEPNSDEQKEKEKYMLFSDENPKAKCTIS